jgi:hypothetical protein
MNDPLITIVHNKEDNFCKLLILYDQSKYYYSESKPYKQLRYFITPYLIETHTDSIILHSKNNKQILLIKF